MNYRVRGGKGLATPAEPKGLLDSGLVSMHDGRQRDIFPLPTVFNSSPPLGLFFTEEPAEDWQEEAF